MGLIYHAALENSLILCFMDSRPWNVPLLVFVLLVDESKMNPYDFLKIGKSRQIYESWQPYTVHTYIM